MAIFNSYVKLPEGRCNVNVFSCTGDSMVKVVVLLPTSKLIGNLCNWFICAPFQTSMRDACPAKILNSWKPRRTASKNGGRVKPPALESVMINRKQVRLQEQKT